MRVVQPTVSKRHSLLGSLTAHPGKLDDIDYLTLDIHDNLSYRIIQNNRDEYLVLLPAGCWAH